MKNEFKKSDTKHAMFDFMDEKEIAASFEIIQMKQDVSGNFDRSNLFRLPRFSRSKSLKISGILFLFLIYSGSLLAQTSAIIPKPGSSNCSISPNAPVCPNSTTTFSAPVGFLSYAWSISGSGTISGPASSQTVKVIAGTNCNSSFTLTVVLTNLLSMTSCTQLIQVIDNSPPILSCIPNKTVSCNTTNIVFDTPTISDGCGTPTLIVLSNNSTNNADGSVSYTRTWKATDGCGNLSSACSQTITVNNLSTCSISGDASLCQGSSTTICAPAGARSYLWNTGETSQCITVANAGTYSLSMIDANGCNNTGSKTISVSVQQPCVISGNSTFCAGSSTTLSGPAGARSYSWNTGSTSQNINVTNPGNYTLTVIDAGGCLSQCNKTITRNDAPVNTISGNSTICLGSSTGLCAPSGNLSYVWNTGATTACINVFNGGNYSVVITDGNGCSSTSNKNVLMNIPQPCSITGSTSVCAGNSMELCAISGAVSYLWSTGETSQCISATATGTYTVSVLDANGCGSACGKSVVVIPPPVCEITGKEYYCSGSTTRICAPSGAFSYLWNTEETSQCISVGTEGSYSVKVTNANGCYSECSKNIREEPIPEFSMTGNFLICNGGLTQLCVPAGFATYQWTNGETTPCINVSEIGNYGITVTGINGCSASFDQTVDYIATPVCLISGEATVCPGRNANFCAPNGMASYLWNTGSTSACITANTPGDYSVRVTNNYGCTNTCTKKLNYYNQAVCEITGSGSVCSGASTVLSAPTGAASYIWNTGSTSQSISVSTAGTYSVTVTNTDGCSSSGLKTISINTLPVCSVNGANAFCAGGSTSLSAPPGSFSYLWNTGETTQNILVNNSGNYSVTITDANGCSNSAGKTVTMNSPASCTINGSNSFCSGSSMSICAPQGPYVYSWNSGATTSCITISTAGLYTATITDANGCISTSSKNITVNNLPVFSINGNNSICAGSTTSLCGPAGASSYVWNTGATSSCITVSAAGTYSLTVTNSTGCSYNSSKTITTNSLPSNSISGNRSFCTGGNTRLCAVAGNNTYLWNTGATTSCITVSNAGNYSMTITDGNGCSSNGSLTVTINPLPAGSISGGNDICEGNVTSLTVTGGNSYAWNTGATSSTINVTAGGNYSVNVTDANGCQNTFTRTLNTHSCGIMLKLTSDVCDFPQGTPTTVNYTYTIKNKSDFFSASGNLTDDNGTPLISSDDIIIGVWGPLAPGDSITFNKAFTFTETHTNTAKATGTEGGGAFSVTAATTVTAVNCNCVLGYPDNSNNPRSGLVFSESEILRASDPGTTNCGSTGSMIKLWYNDEHALLLGIKSVSIKTASGTTTSNYNITSTPSSPTCVSNPIVGDTISIGDKAGNDISDRPLWPSLFITDLTVNGVNNRKGDWQQGGIGRPPTKICGTWKSAVKTIDKTRNPPVVTITTEADPTKNNWNLGIGSDVPPGGFNHLINEGYGAEVCWDINSLSLIPGHTYRLVFMIHDGDQNKAGGDAAESGTIIHIPEAGCISTVGKAAAPTITEPQKICYNLGSNNSIKASQTFSVNSVANSVTIRTTFSKDYVDNTYGNPVIGWNSGHTFSQLTGSEFLQMALFDANNSKKMEFKIDYLSPSSSTPSGFKSLGVSGGEGSMITGNASDVISCLTSLDNNLNASGYQLTTNSPPTDNNYSKNNTYPNWVYDVWYEVTVRLSAFGSAGFGKPLITAVEASPSKVNSCGNTSFVVDPNCISNIIRLAAPESPTHINVIAYPNPFGDNININFIAPLDDETNIIITDITGRVVESFSQKEGTITTGRDLKPGIYFVILNQGDFYRKIKIMKVAGN